NCLEIGGVEVPFLPESELPGFGREEEVEEGAGGSLIGKESGTVIRPPQSSSAAGPSGSALATASPVPTDIPASTTPRADTILSPTTIPPEGATSLQPPALPAGRRTTYPPEAITALTN